MRYLSAHDVLELASPSLLIGAMEQALRDFASQKVIVPARTHVEFEGGTFLTMPVVGGSSFGAKLVSVIPGNAKRGAATVGGLMVLADRTTGAPLATMNAAVLTACRTGAVGALGLKYTTRPDIERLGLIGAGMQGTWQVISACAVRPIREVRFLARSAEKVRHFINAVSSRVPSVRLIAETSVEALVSRADAVIAATTSTTPVLPSDRALLDGKHFISIGSFRADMHEFPSAVYELAGHIVIDSEAARVEVGDVRSMLEQGQLAADQVFHIAEIVTGARTIDVNRTTAYKSVGMALYDLYAAQMLFTEAQRLDRGVRLDP